MADDKAEGMAEETTEATAATEAPDETATDTTAPTLAGSGFNKAIAESEPPTAKSEVTEEPASTEETEEEESAEPAESITDELYSEADKSGISHAQAESLGVESLTRVLRKLSTPDSAQTSDAPAGDAAHEDASGKQADVALDPDAFDPELIKRIEGIESTSAKQIGQLQERLHKLTVDAELRAEHDSKVRFDGMIRNLDGFDKEFGTTTPTRAQQGNRNAMRIQMDVERSGREMHGLPNLSDDQLLQRALSGEYPNKAKQQVREEISSTLTKRAKQHISRPTQSKGPTLTGKQKAMRSVAAKMVNMGLDPGVITNDAEDLSMFGH